ncbi:MAG: antitoxin [bacterium]|nr:antitoxin [bacterium]
MELAQSYIVDEAGDVKSVIIDYERFQQLEELLLDLGLANAMEEVAGEEEVSLEEARKLAGVDD